MTLAHEVEASLVWMSCELMEMIKVYSFDTPLDIRGTSSMTSCLLTAMLTQNQLVQAQK